MKSMRVLMAVWLSGMIAGVVLVERWRRRGEEFVPAEEWLASVDEPLPGSTSRISSRRPHVVGLVITGARLDAERIRRRLRPIDVPRSA